MIEIHIKELPKKGEPLPGGFYAGMLNVSGSVYAIITAPKSLGIYTGEWGPATLIEGAGSVNNGHGNTIALARAKNPMAEWSLSLNIDGLADFYIPARDEREIEYRNLKPTTQANHQGFRIGENPSACRLADRYGYTKALPEQTKAAAFQEGGEQAFDSCWHWTSTQYDAYNAWDQDFSVGGQSVGNKDGKLAARAVRRILVIQ